ncbi:MAG TPA: TolC family protein [Opitutaceae bacterium]
MVEQKIPISGRNRLTAAIAEAGTGMARADLATREIDLIAAAKEAYFETGNHDRQLEHNRENQELARQFIDIAHAKFEVGTETQATVLLGETDLARLEEAALALEGEMAGAHARLNTLMGRPPRTPLGRPLLAETLPGLSTAAELDALAAARHPAIRMAGASIDTDRARLALARRSTFPDPAIRVQARTRNGDNRFLSDYDTAVVFNFPWANPRRTRNEVALAERAVRAAEAEREAAHLAVSGALHEQLARLAASRRQIEVTRDHLRPLARQNIDAKLVAYETAEIRRQPLARRLRVAGIVEDDDTRHRVLAAYVDGRIEKLFVNYVGAEVVAGELLAPLQSAAPDREEGIHRPAGTRRAAVAHRRRA